MLMNKAPPASDKAASEAVMFLLFPVTVQFLALTGPLHSCRLRLVSSAPPLTSELLKDLNVKELVAVFPSEPSRVLLFPPHANVACVCLFLSVFHIDTRMRLYQ